jgi:hypothetical protein
MCRGVKPWRWEMQYAAPQNIKSRNDDYAIIIGGFTLNNVSYIHGRSTRRQHT